MADDDDDDHERSIACLRRRDLELVVPALVVAEVTYLVGRRLGARAEAAFLRGLSAIEIQAPTPDDLVRMSDLVSRYRDFPLGATDASVIALAERLGTPVIITLDRRHFGAVRSITGTPFALLPE